MASRIKSSSGDMEIESTGSGIKFLSSGTEIGSITSGGLLSATTIDATKLTGAIPSSSGATETYVNTAVANAQLSEMTFKGAYNASTNSPDLDTNSVATAVGDMYVVSVAGTFFTTAVEVGDTLIAEISSAAVEGDWVILNKNLDDASIKVAYENNTDTNEFSDADQTKLSGIEAAADVTDVTNVTAAGALMESELVGLVAVKATTGTFLTADQTKLDGIAISANNYSKPSSEPISYVTGLQTALDSKVDDGQVLTDVPTSAVFTDTTYSVGDGGLTQKNFTTTLDTKLSGIATSANNYSKPSSEPISYVSGLQTALDGKLTPTGDGSQLTGIEGGETSLGTNSSATYADGKLFVSSSNIAYWKLDDGSSGDTWFEIGKLATIDGDPSFSIACGYYHTLIIKDDNTVWSVGWNNYGQCGVGSTSNTLASWTYTGKSAVAVAAHDSHSAIIELDGSVSVTGLNNEGQLGIGSYTNKTSFTQHSTAVIATAIDCGEKHTSIIGSNGNVWATGYGANGQRGDGSASASTTFTDTSVSAKKLKCGERYTMIIKSDDSVWATGRNSYGQLGDGTMTQRNSFTDVGIDAKSLGCGADHSMVVKLDGSVWGTGYNSSGFLGTGNTTNYSSWTAADSACPTSSLVFCGYYTSFVVAATTGIVWGCGNNSSGNLGTGNTTNYTSFTSSGVTAEAVAIGRQHTLILQADKTTRTTGKNGYYQLGVSNSSDRSSFSLTDDNSSGSWTYIPGNIPDPSAITDPVNLP